MIKIDFRKIIGYYSPEFPVYDPTTPWYEWNMYVECCNSLDVKDQPHWQRYKAFSNYLKSIGVL